MPFEGITHLVEHPIKLKPIGGDDDDDDDDDDDIIEIKRIIKIEIIKE